jgi:hypothetical protein
MRAIAENLRPIFLSLVAAVALAGCAYGWTYMVTYSAYTAEARAALLKKLQDTPSLRGYLERKDEHLVRLSISCPSDHRRSPSFVEERRKIEESLGAELLRMMSVSTQLYPNP